MTIDPTILAAAAALQADITKANTDIALIAATASSVQRDVTQAKADLAALVALIPDPDEPPAPPVPPAPSSNTIVLPSQPAGLPAGKTPPNLTCVLADGFSLDGPEFSTPDSIFGAFARGPFNADEVASFDPGRVSRSADGAVLSCTYAGKIASGANKGLDGYMSALLTTTMKSSLGGFAGQNITGFLFLPAAGVTSVVEFVVTIPGSTADNMGFDFGMWAAGPKGRGEIDFPELMWHPASSGKAAYNAAYYNVLNHVSGGQANPELSVYGKPWMSSGGKHTFTTVINGVSNLQAYVDGQYLGQAGWSTGTNPVEPLNLLLSYGMRNFGATFTNTKTVTVRSAQFWTDHPTQGKLAGSGEAETLSGGYVLGGGIAPGTTLA